MPARLFIGLAVIVLSSVACDQGGPSEERSETMRASQTLSETSGNGGQVGVQIRINHNPEITAMNAEWVSQSQQRFSAQVVERDGDSVKLVWSFDCAGSFDDPGTAQPIFTYDLPLPATCTVHLKVSDGQGGTHTGDLSLSLTPVTVVEEP